MDMKLDLTITNADMARAASVLRATGDYGCELVGRWLRQMVPMSPISIRVPARPLVLPAYLVDARACWGSWQGVAEAPDAEAALDGALAIAHRLWTDLPTDCRYRKLGMLLRVWPITAWPAGAVMPGLLEPPVGEVTYRPGRKARLGRSDVPVEILW